MVQRKGLESDKQINVQDVEFRQQAEFFCRHVVQTPQAKVLIDCIAPSRLRVPAGLRISNNPPTFAASFGLCRPGSSEGLAQYPGGFRLAPAMARKKSSRSSAGSRRPA
jgi:hypothetical protein